MNGNATATGYIKGYGLQWNMLPIVAGCGRATCTIVQSEHKCGNYPWETGDRFNPDMRAQRLRVRRRELGAAFATGSRRA